jgi:hypothetical protein
MSLEQAIQNLADAINRLAGAAPVSIGTTAAPIQSAAQEAKSKGKAAKAAEKPEPLKPFFAVDENNKVVGDEVTDAPNEAAPSTQGVTYDDLKGRFQQLIALDPTKNLGLREQGVEILGRYKAKAISDLRPDQYQAVDLDVQFAINKAKSSGAADDRKDPFGG